MPMPFSLSRKSAGVVLLLLTTVARGQSLEAGAVRGDITPPLGGPLWGYAARHDAPSNGIHDRLSARVLVLRSGVRHLVLVSLDLGRPPTRQSTAVIRQRVQQALGDCTLFLVATHTHHGPVLELEDWPAPGAKSYKHQLEETLVQLILQAARQRRPARLGFASRAVPYNRNRHSRRPDAPVDRELLVARVEDMAGKPLAHLVHFAAHATLREPQSRQISADYPGILAQQVEQASGAPCLFLQGAAGDLSPQLGGQPLRPETFGQALAEEVLRLSKGLSCSQTQGALRACEHDFCFRKRLNPSDPLVRAALGLAFFPRLIDFYEREYREGVRPHLTTALWAGEVGLVGVSGEFFCGHALSLKRRARLKHVLFLGYCNDYHQYFPTIEAAAEGGYGTTPALAPAELGAGERIVDQALLDLYQLRGLLPAAP
jgi:neutral ceramidase